MFATTLSLLYYLVIRRCGHPRQPCRIPGFRHDRFPFLTSCPDARWSQYVPWSPPSFFLTHSAINGTALLKPIIWHRSCVKMPRKDLVVLLDYRVLIPDSLVSVPATRQCDLSPLAATLKSHDRQFLFQQYISRLPRCVIPSCHKFSSFIHRS